MVKNIGDEIDQFSDLHGDHGEDTLPVFLLAAVCAKSRAAVYGQLKAGRTASERA